jgi:hypothetical protein
VIEEGSVGRFWGYRGLHRELAIRQVTPEVGIAAGRIARRWYRAKGPTKKVTVRRVERGDRLRDLQALDGSEAAVRLRARVPSVNDGAEFASQVARYLSGLAVREFSCVH